MTEVLVKACEVRALPESRAVSFEVFPGEAVCLFGMNGSGKTLLLKAICGIFRPYEGRIEINACKSRRGVCLQFPEHLVFHETALAEALLITGDGEKAAALLREIGAEPEQSPFFMSDGQKRLLFLYGFLETKELLVFDEPFASLDRASRERVAAKIAEAKKNGRAVIYTANRERDLFCADKVIRIEKHTGADTG